MTGEGIDLDASRHDIFSIRHYWLVRDGRALEPIFVFDRDGWLYIEAKGLPLSLEAIDANDGEYEVAYDLEGECLVVAVEGPPSTGEVVLRSTGRRDAADLERRVLAYLEKSKMTVSTDGDDFLVNVANAIAVDEWARRWPRRPRWLANRLHGERPHRYARPTPQS